MGNINDTWYFKNSGGDWASSKCELDSCYSIPFDSVNDEHLYLQVDLPVGSVVNQIWLCSPDGTHHLDVKPMTDWKIIDSGGLYRLIFRVPNNVTCTPATGLECFHFEIPLLSEEDLTEIGVLVSEPFHCPVCEPTVKISSDYCFSRTDIFGTFVFDTDAFEGTKSGNIDYIRNDFRIQAVLKQLPSQVNANRNIRCFNYRSRLQQRYKLQGAYTDFPDYMVNIIESIFSGKKIYVDGEEYVLSGEQIFIERGTAGRSMKRLDVELQKCEIDTIHNCRCEPLVINCEENPLVYNGDVFLAPASGMGYPTVDFSYYYASIDPSQISGGIPPYTIHNWMASSGNAVPDNTFELFDDHRSYNLFRRTDLSPGSLSVTLKITDSRGCTIGDGITVTIPDMRCCGYDASFETGTITSNSIEIMNIIPSGWSKYDISIDALYTGYQFTGVTSDPFVISGLSPGTEYHLIINVKCPVHAGVYMDGMIGQLTVHTLP